MGLFARFCVTAVLSVVLFIQAKADTPLFLPLDSLLPGLQEGGYVIYFRHAATDHDQQDAVPVRLDDCSGQRNLSDLGRRQAKAIGRAFKTLNIPVGEILSSPFCRCKDTANLAFGKAEIRDFLFFAIGLDAAQRAKVGRKLTWELASRPLPGKNKIIVSHTANLKEATGIWPKPEGAAIVFRPTGDGLFETVGRITPEDWIAAAKR